MADWFMDESGLATASFQLTEAVHQLTFAVEDTAGAVTEESISIEILRPNEDPSCMISVPTSDQWWELGTTASFEARFPMWSTHHLSCSSSGLDTVA